MSVCRYVSLCGLGKKYIHPILDFLKSLQMFAVQSFLVEEKLKEIIQSTKSP